MRLEESCHLSRGRCPPRRAEWHCFAISPALDRLLATSWEDDLGSDRPACNHKGNSYIDSATFDLEPALKASEVFTPTGVPTVTYIQREEQNLEEQLRSAIKTPGLIASLSGPSKSGKTVLINKVIPQDISLPFLGQLFEALRGSGTAF